MRIAITSDLHRGFNKNTVIVHDKFFKELSQEDFEVLIIAGDLISHKQKQLKSLFRHIRKYISTPILIVSGNHDFWNKSNDKRFNDLDEMLDYRYIICQEYDIFDLQDYSYKKDNIMFCGYDGWYNDLNPPTNDIYYLPKDYNGMAIHKYLNMRAHQSFNEILLEVGDEANKDFKKVCVTHFNPYLTDRMYEQMMGIPSHLPEIVDNFNLLICGHTHREHDKTIFDCRIINVGSDYNKPKYKIMEI